MVDPCANLYGFAYDFIKLRLICSIVTFLAKLTNVQRFCKCFELHRPDLVVSGQFGMPVSPRIAISFYQENFAKSYHFIFNITLIAVVFFFPPSVAQIIHFLFLSSNATEGSENLAWNRS